MIWIFAQNDFHYDNSFLFELSIACLMTPSWVFFIQFDSKYSILLMESLNPRSQFLSNRADFADCLSSTSYLYEFEVAFLIKKENGCPWERFANSEFGWNSDFVIGKTSFLILSPGLSSTTVARSSCLMFLILCLWTVTIFVWHS